MAEKMVTLREGTEVTVYLPNQWQETWTLAEPTKAKLTYEAPRGIRFAIAKNAKVTRNGITKVLDAVSVPTQKQPRNPEADNLLLSEALTPESYKDFEEWCERVQARKLRQVQQELEALHYRLKAKGLAGLVRDENGNFKFERETTNADN